MIDSDLSAFWPARDVSFLEHLLSTLSHHLSAPLTVILGETDTLQ
jgi:K+-sensing histidine kinase KdpD